MPLWLQASASRFRRLPRYAANEFPAHPNNDGRGPAMTSRTCDTTRRPQGPKEPFAGDAGIKRRHIERTGMVPQ